jgi:3-deoxy-D-manno-octulosonic-acid transferase
VNRFVYTSLIRLLSPGLLAWMALRARRAGGQWHVWSGARFGYYAGPARLRRPVWVHAVSLGETRAAQPLVQALLDQGDQVLLTQMTATGQAEARKAFAHAIQAGQLDVQWMPYDFPGATRRFFEQYTPCAGVLIEREVWPNLLAAARNAQVPMLLASARFSDHSLRQSLRIGSVMRQAYASFAAVYAQTLEDAQRLEQAGAIAPRVSGNFKFDVSLPQEKIQRARQFAAAVGRKVIVIASTREGEDEPFVRAIQRYQKHVQMHGLEEAPRALFCLIPRHPQRFDEAAAVLQQAGVPYVRRSDLLAMGDGSTRAQQACRDAAVLLGDTLGEMPWYYGMGNAAIIGGSFEPLGGQNLIEACAVGVPVIVGPHTWNFQQAVADALLEGAAVRVATAEAAVQQALAWLDEPATLARMSQAAGDWVLKHSGAVARVLGALSDMRRRQGA